MFKYLASFIVYFISSINTPSDLLAAETSSGINAATQTISELIVWNVGQGSWATEVHPDLCIHFDLGGEKNPSAQVLRLCRKKKNYLNLSHWDWDHISFVGSFTKNLKKVCLVRLPQGKTSPRKQKMMDRLSICPEKDSNRLKQYAYRLFKPWKARNSNDQSEILFSTTFQVIFPGDSSKAQEKYWREKAPAYTKGLILGHHGSSTSTSQELLNLLPSMKWAVASARYRRYRHPHWKVAELLKKNRIPLLKTEDWGHLHFLKVSN